MKEIIRLLELKNEYLEKFLAITRAFTMELENGRLGDVELLKQNRENILDIIEHIDERIAKLAESCMDLPDNNMDTLRAQVSDAMFVRDGLVSEILMADKELFIFLEAEKVAISEELADLRAVGNAFAGYGRALNSN